MKKIFLILFVIIINLSIFGSEKIVDIKYKKDGERKFFLVDEEGRMDYGFYEYNIYEKLISPKDETIEIYNGKVNLDIIEDLAMYHKKMRLNAIGIGLGMGFGTFFTVGGAGCLYFAFNPSGYDKNREVYYYINLSMGITYLVSGLAALVIGFVAIGLTAFNGYHYKQTKKEIIDLLNNASDATSIKSDKLKIKFCFNIDFRNHNLDFY